MGCCFIELRDRTVLKKIVEFCERIDSYIARNKASKEAFMNDLMFQDACLMCVVQIGELVVLLHDDVKNLAKDVPWRIIKDTRNKYVHKYGTIDLDMVWATLNKDIPKFKTDCEKLLELN